MQGQHVGSAKSSALIEQVCVSPAHVALGRSVPDGLGVLTIHEGAWAYCPSARPGEAHEWRAIPPTELPLLRHARGWSATPSP